MLTQWNSRSAIVGVVLGILFSGESQAVPLQDRMTRRERAILAAVRTHRADAPVTDAPGAVRRTGTHRSSGRRKREPDLSICGVAELPRFANQRITHVVSIWNRWEVADDAVRRRMKALFPAARKHYAFFDDITEPGTRGPSMDAVRSILNFTGTLHRRERLLVHCTKGISRSPAIAFAVLCQRTGPGHEAECLAEVKRVRPVAVPNPLVVRYADTLLNRNGAMVAALQAR